jgi:hypothetical protein
MKTIIHTTLFFLLLSGAARAQEIVPPEEFFGFQLGADRELARWDRIVDYFEHLDERSDRIQVTDLGPSTEGYPYLLVIVTSPDNMRRLEQLRQNNVRIQDPRTPEEDVRGLIEEGVAVVSQSFGLHSTEVAGAQTPPELSYDLATRNDAETLRILDNTIMLMFPNFNPDGQIMVTDWYYENKGTDYEGVGLPWLYHKYVGHDNNRDADFLNMVEAQYTAKVLYKDWKPQAYVDHHQMGSYGARMYVPPYSEPIRPYADPLVWRELSWYGAHVAYKLEEDGRTGILNAGQYPGWGHFGWHWITPMHNMTGMLTESASASLATPLYIHPDQLRGGARGLPEYEAQSNMPSPWPGGWWRLRDIVEQQKIAAWAIQDHAARNKETVLWNGYLKAKRQMERGASGSPKAYVIPADQHDPLTMTKMINTLLASDIEIYRTAGDTEVDGMSYAAGSYIVPLAQPKMGLVRNLLGRTFYPDNDWTRARDGTPLRPYDTATHTMAEFMGVRVDPVDTAVDEGARLFEPVMIAGGADGEGSFFAIDGRHNASYKAVNLLLNEGAEAYRAARPGSGIERGDFIVEDHQSLAAVAEHTGVTFRTLDAFPSAAREIERKRVGMYQRYRGGSMDEGWTRFVLEQFEFPYTTLHDDDITRGRLASRHDVIILPHDPPEMISGEEMELPPGRSPQIYPPQYMSGLGEEGAAELKQFVEDGGTLIALGDASEYAIDTFELRIRNVVEDVNRNDFYAPGSTLRVTFDTDNRLAYGMPDRGVVLYWSNPVFEILPSRANDSYVTVARYVDRDILQSGWLIGEDHLSNKAAMVAANVGDGRVIVYGFRPQHRAQTHGTFKLFFNALLD